MRHSRAKIFFLLYLCAIIYLSLYPGEFTLRPKMDRLLWVPVVGRRQILDFVLNVLFYLPLGVAGCLSFRRRGLGLLTAVVVGGCLSWTIEWLQLWMPFRFGNLTDLVSNTAGTLLGASLAFAASRWNWLPGHRADSLWQLKPTPSLLFGLWILWQTFPFVPAAQLVRLTGFFTLLAPWAWLPLIEAFLGFAALRFAVGRSLWIWVAYAAIPAQAFLLERSLSPAALCGASLGWIVARLTGSAGLRWLGFVLPTWLLVEELRPFSFTGQFSPLRWAPFETWYQATSLGYYPIIFGKLFLYLSVIWALRERGTTPSWSVGIPAAILLGGEWAQQYLVGRTPESTDWILLAAAAALLALFSRAEPVRVAAPAAPDRATGAVPRRD
ncbi:MAG: VanZ family protein [Bryobacteraceae bacterium]